MDYQIISDSSCDLVQSLREKYDIEVVPFYISFDGENYQKEVEEIAIDDVYKKMVDFPKQYPKTSLPSVQNYVDAFTAHAKEGRAVICICITTSLSGSYNSACNAKEIVLEEYPDAKITVINSLGATVLQGLFVIEAAKLKQSGATYEEVVEKLTSEEYLATGRIFFTVGNTDYLKHGGRIGKVASVASSALNLKPLITLKDGSIDASGIARSRKKSVLKTYELVKNYFEENGEDPNDYVYAVGYGYDKEEGLEYKKQLDEIMRGLGLKEEIGIAHIGATICVHTGPYAIGVGLIKKLQK